MTQKTEPRKFYKVSFHDDEWLDEQSGSVLKLFRECAKADPYGDEAPINSSLKRTAFFEAKKTLEQAGICKFRQAPGENDGRRIQWFVTYLHGSNNRDYWKGFAVTNSISNEEADAVNLQFATTNSISAMANCKSATANSSLPETLFNSGFSSSLDFNQNESENLIVCKNENLVVSPSGDSLRSTHMVGCELEEPLSLDLDPEAPLETEDLGVHHHLVSNEETPEEPNLLVVQAKERVSLVQKMTDRSGNKDSAAPHVVSPQTTPRPNEDAHQAPFARPNVQSQPKPSQATFLPQLDPGELKDALVELRESLQAIVDDVEVQVDGGIESVCERFAGLVTNNEGVELLRVPREYPYYDLMNEWVLHENGHITCFVKMNDETRRLIIGRFK